MRFGGGGLAAGRYREEVGKVGGGGGGGRRQTTRTVQSMLGGTDERAALRTKVAMWWCEHCNANTFLQRRACFSCRRPRTGEAIVVDEYWKVEMLPIDVRRQLEEGGPRGQGGGGGFEWGGSEPVHGGAGCWGDGGGGKGGKTRRGDQNDAGPPEGKGATGKGKEHARPVGRIGAGGLAGQAGGEGKGGRWAAGDEEAVRAEGSAAEEDGGAANMEVDEKPGKVAGSGTRPKAKAKGGHTGRQKEEEKAMDGGGAGTREAARLDEGIREPQPYVHPSEPRIVLAGRLEAFKEREAEMRKKGQGSDDVRVQRAKKKIEETEKMVKTAGGKTQSKLVFSVMDARKDVGEAEKALSKAEEDLAATTEQATKWLQEQGRAEALVRLRTTELANCKSRVAHLGFQFAAEAACDVAGYGELSSAMHLVWAGVESSGMQGVLPALQQMVTFIEKFRPVEYAAEDDLELRELASGQGDAASATSTATLVVGEVEEHNEEKAEGTQRGAGGAGGAAPIQTAAPAAFRSEVQAKEAVQLALAVEAKQPMPAAWVAGRGREAAKEKEGKNDNDRGPRRERSASRSRGRTEGEAEAGGEDRPMPTGKVARKG